MNKMIHFHTEGFSFLYRTVAVIIHENKVLLHRLESDAFWSLPGGRVELGEDSITALCREMKEELGAEAKVERLLWIIENFFLDHTNKGSLVQEVGFYYLVKLPQEFPFYGQKDSFYGQEKEIPLLFQWHDIEGLEDEILYPLFLRKALKDLPPHPVQVIQRDE